MGVMSDVRDKTRVEKMGPAGDDTCAACVGVCDTERGGCVEGDDDE